MAGEPYHLTDPGGVSRWARRDAAEAALRADVDPAGRCNCAQRGNALTCPVHTQEDFEAADRAREVDPVETDPLTPEQIAYYQRLRALALAADAGWGPDGWYSEHEFQHAFRHTTTDLEADVAYLRAASPDVVVGLVDMALAAAAGASQPAADEVPSEGPADHPEERWL